MDKLQFGNKDKLILSMKLKQFSKSIATPKSAGARLKAQNMKDLEEKLHLEIRKTRSRVEYMAKDPKWYLKLVNIEVKKTIFKFFTKEVVPGLVESWYFDTYQLIKIIDKKTQKNLFVNKEGEGKKEKWRDVYEWFDSI